MYNIGKKNEETDYEMKASEDESKNIAKCNEKRALESFLITVSLDNRRCINKANKMICVMKRIFPFLLIKKVLISSILSLSEVCQCNMVSLF